MADFNFLVPILTVAPPPGYRLLQAIPLEGLAGQLRARSATIDLCREVIVAGKVVDRHESLLVLRDGLWADQSGAEYALDPVAEADWNGGRSIAYVETHIAARDTTFTQNREPSSYVVFAGPERKSFLSDSSPKFSHPAVISQIVEYGKWAEGYPACAVDPSIDADESVVLINPYERPATVSLEFERRPETPRVRVEPLSATRLSMSQILGAGGLPWSGQVYVQGPRRVAVFFVKHSLADPSSVNTMEHSDAFRGETHWLPATQALHWRYRERYGLR